MAENSTIVHIGADVSELAKATKELQNQFKNMGVTIENGMTNANDVIKQVSNALNQQSVQLNNVGLQWQKMGKEQTEALTQRLDKLITQMEKLITVSQQASADTARVANGVGELNKNLRVSSQSARDTTTEVNNMGERGSRSVKKLSTEIGLLKKSFDYLKWTITRVFWFGAVLQFQKALSGIVTEGSKWERTVASLSAMTDGNIEQAIQLESIYSDLGKAIPYTSDEISKSALILNKTGLKPTKELLIALGKIASGTGQSMFTQATALTSVVTGNLRGLRMMGIEAKDNGDTIIMSYKGQTEEIKKNTKALSEYIQKFADANFSSTLEFQMQGLSGKIHSLNEDWGNLSKAMHQAGGKEIVGDTIDYIHERVESLIAYFSDTKTRTAILSVWDGLKAGKDIVFDTIEKIKTWFVDLIPSIDGTMFDLTDSTDKACRTIQQQFGHLGVYIYKVFQGISTVFKTIDDAIEWTGRARFANNQGVTVEQNAQLKQVYDSLSPEEQKKFGEEFSKNFAYGVGEYISKDNTFGNFVNKNRIGKLMYDRSALDPFSNGADSYNATVENDKRLAEKQRIEALQASKQIKAKIVQLEKELATATGEQKNSIEAQLKEQNALYDKQQKRYLEANKRSNGYLKIGETMFATYKVTQEQLNDVIKNGTVDLDKVSELADRLGVAESVVKQSMLKTMTTLEETSKKYAEVSKATGENALDEIEGLGDILVRSYDQIVADANKNYEKTKSDADKKKKEIEQYRKENNAPDTGTTFGDNGKTGGKLGKEKEQRDTWTAYYQKLEDAQLNHQNKAKQLYADYIKDLAELEKVASENSFVTAQMKNDAKIKIEEEYYQKVMQLRQDASNFIASLDEENNEILKLQDEYTQKLEMLESYHDASLISEQVYQDNLRRINEDTQRKIAQQDYKKAIKPYKETGDALSTLADGFSQLTSNLDENSQAYKVAFSIQKGFAVASATTSAVLAWMQALSDPSAMTWPQKLANYATAIALTTQVLAQLASISMHDKGGTIPAGGLGIVGEYGPELVSGPASVTSRKKTEDLLSGSKGDVIVNLYEDSSRAGQVSQQKNDNETIINIIVNSIRNGGDVDGAISNTYGMKRVGA